MPMASDALSPAAAHNCRNSSKRSPEMSTCTRQAGRTTWCGGDAHRVPSGSSSGSASAILARALPTQPRRADVAVGRPRRGAHVPVEGGTQIPGGLQVFGDQRGVLLRRCRVTRLDCGRNAPVQLGAVGFEL